jgi:hypothetical protein
LELRDVHIAESSLLEAWYRISRDFGIRTIAFSDRPFPGDRLPFNFDRDRCTVDELLTALVATYPGYTRTQDKETGVIWIHPATNAYETILARRVVVQENVRQVPLLTDVFNPLCRLKPVGMMRWGMMGGGENTLDSPVDLPAGAYPARDVLNRCCLSSPNRTFCIERSRSAALTNLLVTPLTVVPYKPVDGGAPPTPGALLYWRVEINPLAKEAPTDSEFTDALASHQARVRFAARNYLDMTLPLAQVHRLLTQPAPADRAVWVAVGVLSVLTRSEEVAAWPAAAASLRSVLSDTEALADKPALRALAVTELARAEKDPMFLEEAAKRPLSAAQIADVKLDLIRNLRYSSFVRSKLLELNPRWAGLSTPEIEALGQTNIFSLP